MATPQEVYQYWLDNGMKPHEAAALTGNFVAESNLDPTIHNKQGSGAFGTAQWLGSRKQDLINYAKANNRDVNDIFTQLDFANHELHGKESGALKRLQQTNNVEDATYAVAKYYERPSDKEISGSIHKRTNVAKSLLGSNGSGSSIAAGGSGDEDPLTVLNNYRKLKSNPDDDPNKILQEFRGTKPKEVTGRNIEDEDPLVELANYRKSKPKELTVIDNTKPETVETTLGDKVFNAIGFNLNSINKGLASTADAIVNAPENVMKMGVAGISYGLNKAGLISADELPELNTPTNVVTDKAKELGVISSDPNYNPTSGAGRVADIAIQSSTGGLASKGNLVKNLATGAGVGAGIGTAIEAGVDPTTAIGLGVVAPIAVKGIVKIPSKVVSAVDKQIPFYYDKGANVEAARRIVKQSGTNLTPQELATVIENKLATGDKQLHTTGELLGNNKLRASQTTRANTDEYNNLSKAVNQDVIDKTKEVFKTTNGTGGFISTKNKVNTDSTARGLESNMLYPDKVFDPHNVTKIFNASNTPEELVDNLFINSGVKELNLQGIKALVKDGVISKQALVKTIQEGIIDNNSTNPQVNTVRLNNILSDTSNAKTLNYLLGSSNKKLKNSLQRDLNERSSVISTDRNSTSVLDAKVNNLLNKNPTLANTLVGGTVGLVTGNPIYGVLSGVLGKSFTSGILENLTTKQNIKLQAAITKGLLDPKELAETLKGMKPEKAKTTLAQKLDSIKLEANTNDAYTLPSVNKLTQQEDK